MTETPKVGLELKIFARSLMWTHVLSKSLLSGAQGADLAPPQVLKDPKYAGPHQANTAVMFGHETAHLGCHCRMKILLSEMIWR